MAEQTITKRCTKCKEIKPVSEFSKNRTRKDGHHCWCKNCISKSYSKYSQTEKGKETHREACRKHSKTAKRKLTSRRHRLSDKGKITRKRYRQSEKCKATEKHYRQTEECKLSQNRYNATHKGKVTRQRIIKRYRIRHPERALAHKAVRHAITTGELPRPDSLQCSCGEQAKEYHHHLGYEPEHHLHVIPLCKKCHTSLSSAI